MPLELVYVILVGWAVVIAIIAVTYLWFNRTEAPFIKKVHRGLLEGGRKKRRRKKTKRSR